MRQIHGGRKFSLLQFAKDKSSDRSLSLIVDYIHISFL